MHRHHGDTFIQPGHRLPPPKYMSTQSTSSAFSVSANPNEDWTKISDLAERRRIQNRIAQRNYRKKIKRRLEDLERKAGSSSASPDQVHAELVPSSRSRQNSDAGVKRRKSKGEPQRRMREGSSPSPPLQYSPFDGDQMINYPYQYSRDISNSPPPSFSYSYAMTDLVDHSPYPRPASPGLRAAVPDYSSHSLYLPPLPTTLPSMSPYEMGPAKEGNSFDEDMLSQYNMTYPPMAGVDMANAHVNGPDFFKYFP